MTKPAQDAFLNKDDHFSAWYDRVETANGLVTETEPFHPNKQTFDPIASGPEARAYHSPHC